MVTLLAPPGSTGQTSPQGGSGGAALGGPKKLRPVVMRRIGPRRSGPKWQERAWNRLHREKQMTTNARWLMRLGAGTHRSPVSTATHPYRQATARAVAGVRGRP